MKKKNDEILISKGFMENNKYCNGIIIKVNKNDEIESEFSFKINDESKYEFEIFNDKKQETEIIEEYKRLKFKDYNDNIQKLIEQILTLFKNFTNTFQYSSTVEINKNFKNFFEKLCNDLFN